METHQNHLVGVRGIVLLRVAVVLTSGIGEIGLVLRALCDGIAVLMLACVIDNTVSEPGTAARFRNILREQSSNRSTMPSTIPRLERADLLGKTSKTIYSLTTNTLTGTSSWLAQGISAARKSAGADIHSPLVSAVEV